MKRILSRSGWMGLVVAGLMMDGVPGLAQVVARPPLQVVATVGMVADVVREVGGDRVQVQALMGAGVDPHLYKPTRGDVASLLAADLVFYSGLMLEGRMGDLLGKLGQGGKPVVAVTDGLDRARLLDFPAKPGHYDPHVWMDVSLWRQTVDAIANALSAADPEHAAAYAERAQRYGAQLDKLHAYVVQVMATLPTERRLLVTAHDAFGYFGRAYGLEVRGIQGVSTESEAGLEGMQRLLDIIVERKVPSVFVETSVAEKNVRALVEGAAAREHTLAVGASLFSDAMGATGTYEGTYIGMLDHNATTIARALGGQAPERGWQGKLGGAP
jgi:manganese/zinc/iron transport system substrate-binding protein